MKNFTLKVIGLGYEIVMGGINKDQYIYWQSHLNQLLEYVFESHCEIDVADNIAFVAPGEWHGCDDICHEKGCKLNGEAKIVIEDDSGDVIWSSEFSKKELIKNGILPNKILENDEITEVILHHDFVYSGKLENSGLMYSGTFKAKKFEPDKLVINITKIGEILLDSEIYVYDGKELEDGDIDYASHEFEVELFNSKNCQVTENIIAQRKKIGIIAEKREAAKNLFDAGEMDRAIKEYNDVLLLISNDNDCPEDLLPDCKQQLAVFHIIKGDSAVAHDLLIQVLDAWRKLFGDYSGPYGVTSGYIGWNLFKSKKYEEAISYLEKNILIIKNQVNHYHQLGSSLFHLGRFKESENIFLMMIGVINGNDPIAEAYAYKALFKIAATSEHRLYDKLNYGGLAMHYINQSDDSAQFSEFISEYNEFILEAENINNDDFLRLCENGNVPALKKVIDSGFNIDERFSNSDLADRPILYALDGDTAKFIAENSGDWFLDIDNRNLTIEMLKNAANGTCGFQALQYVLENDSSINSNWDGNNGDFPIHAAVRTGVIEIVSAVIEAGGDLKLASNEGDTPIGIAIGDDRIEIVKLLLKCGSPINSSAFHFNIEFDDEDDVPEIIEPLNLAQSEEMKSVLKDTHLLKRMK
jgi:tetratricopeptide (TPR) repeat protein